MTGLESSPSCPIVCSLQVLQGGCDVIDQCVRLLGVAVNSNHVKYLLLPVAIKHRLHLEITIFYVWRDNQICTRLRNNRQIMKGKFRTYAVKRVAACAHLSSLGFLSLRNAQTMEPAPAWAPDDGADYCLGWSGWENQDIGYNYWNWEICAILKRATAATVK